jgi:hypothetical protein
MLDENEDDEDEEGVYTALSLPLLNFKADT